MQVALSNLIAAQLQRAQAEKSGQAAKVPLTGAPSFLKELGAVQGAAPAKMSQPPAQPAPVVSAPGALETAAKGAPQRPGTFLDLTV
jgi:hypothetical protein